MSTDEKIDKLAKLVKEIHQSVLVIENEHGQKLEALFDGFDSVNKRLGSMDNRLDSMDNKLDSMDNKLDSMDKRLGKVEVSVAEIKNGFGLLKAIASDYENRISILEKKISDHLESHP